MKEKISTITNDIVTFYFDLDPYNGETIEEAFCSTLDDLLENDGKATTDSLECIVGDTEEIYSEDDKKIALALLNRLVDFLANQDTKEDHRTIGQAIRFVAGLENFDMKKRSAKDLLDTAEKIRSAVIDIVS